MPSTRRSTPAPRRSPRRPRATLAAARRERTRPRRPPARDALRAGRCGSPTARRRSPAEPRGRPDTEATGTLRVVTDYDRLSALDASFLHLESPETPMHVGSLGIFDGAPFFDGSGRFRLAEVRARWWRRGST